MLSANSPEGAFYMAGYSVECALKACITKFTKRHDFPDRTRVNDSWIHDLARLISVADLKSAHDEAMRQFEFARRWKIVVQWKERENSLEDAEYLIEAIENRKYGVLPWLRKYW